MVGFSGSFTRLRKIGKRCLGDPWGATGLKVSEFVRSIFLWNHRTH